MYMYANCLAPYPSSPSSCLPLHFLYQIANFPPMIQGPDIFRITIDEISTYTVNVTDPDVNETFIVMIMADIGTLPDGYMFTGINSEYIFTVTITEVVNFTFSIVANDSSGASSTIQPQVCLYCINFKCN